MPAAARTTHTSKADIPVRRAERFIVSVPGSGLHEVLTVCP